MAKNILIIDDEEEILFLLSLALEKENYSVKKALNFKEALSILEGEGFDIILMDYYLPEINGVEISKIIYEKGIKTPVILFTAAELENLKEALPPNIVDVLKKPFNIDDVIEHLNKTLKMKEYLQEISSGNKKEDKGGGEFDEIVSLERLGQLKKVIAQLNHTIKNALQTISTNVELIEKGYVNGEELVHCINSIKRKIAFIKEELDLLKHVEELTVTAHFSLKNCIRDVLRELKAEIKKKDIYIKTDFMKRLPLYYGQKAIVYRMLKNLFFFLINCSAPSGRLEIGLYLHQQLYFIEINQSGMSPYCESVLELFNSDFSEKVGELAKVVLLLKEIGGKINFSITEDASLNVKLSFPAH